jgi:hypothetical protein
MDSLNEGFHHMRCRAERVFMFGYVGIDGSDDFVGEMAFHYNTRVEHVYLLVRLIL